MNGYGMGFGWFWAILLLAGVAALVWGLARAAGPGQGPGPRAGVGPETGHDRSRAILRERFARGEITEAELREGMRVLDEG